MIFESLADRLQQTFKKLRGHGKLTEDDVNEAMREVRMALLEADVNFKVVKDFIKKVKERAVGQDVLDTLTPARSSSRSLTRNSQSSWAARRAASIFRPCRRPSS